MKTYTTREIGQRVANVQCRTADIKAAAELSLPYSAYLDLAYDPEKDGETSGEDVRTGFEVALDSADMTTEVNPAAGIYPNRCEDIYENDTQLFLMKELSLSTFRSIAYKPQLVAAQKQQRRREQWERAGSINFVHDTAPGTALTPYTDAMAHWDEEVDVDIAVEELTTRFAETSKKDYRATVMEYDQDAFRLDRSEAGSNPPMAKFGTTEWTIQPQKRRLAIPFSYDFLMDVEYIDKAMEHIEEIAIQQIIARADEGIEAMIHGAGATQGDESLEATIIRLQDLDASATDNITPTAWLALQKRFKRRYMLTSVIAPDDGITALQLAKISGTNVMLMNLIERERAEASGFGGGFEIMNQTSQGVRLGWHDYLENRILETPTSGPTVLHDAALVYDKRKGVEFVSKMNSDIMETTRDVLKELEFIVCSETWGWISYQPTAAIKLVCLGNPAAESTLSIVSKD